MLEVDRVSFDYAGTRAVSDASFRAGERGELIALIGPNGSGKSTLLKMLARVLVPSTGEVRFDGKPLGQWNAREYARRVGYLPQDPDPVFPMRAIDVVVSGRAPFLGRFQWERDSDYAGAENALVLCDAGHLADRYLDEMSGGERKRIFLARVLAAKPSLILLDEPLTALDIAHVQQFARLLRDVADRTGATILFAAHDVNWAAAYSNRMLVMDRGALALDSAPSEVMKADVMARFFGVDAAVVSHGGQTWVVPR